MLLTHLPGLLRHAGVLEGLGGGASSSLFGGGAHHAAVFGGGEAGEVGLDVAAHAESVKEAGGL